MQRNILNSAEIAALSQAGINLAGARIVMDDRDPWKGNLALAMDAQPTLISTVNSGIPSFLTTVVDPNLLRILTSPNKGAKILGEERKGSWTDVTALFPVVEQTGEVSSYGDFNNNGRAGINTNFPQRESYFYQAVIEYGDLELERAGLAKIQYASEVKDAAANILQKYQNLTYFYGVAGLQNYGILNDPSLSAPMAPAVKAAGGVKWMVGNVLNATPNEVYNDVVGLFAQLVAQSGGLVDQSTKMVLGLSPKSEVALTSTNQYNVNVGDLLKKNFPNIRIESAVQYGAQSAQNPQGSAAGEVVQLIAEEVEGQNTGYCSFPERLRTFPIVRQLSSFQQKMMQGTWGAIWRQPFACSQMLGV